VTLQWDPFLWQNWHGGPGEESTVVEWNVKKCRFVINRNWRRLNSQGRRRRRSSDSEDSRQRLSNRTLFRCGYWGFPRTSDRDPLTSWRFIFAEEILSYMTDSTYKTTSAECDGRSCTTTSRQHPVWSGTLGSAVASENSHLTEARRWSDKRWSSRPRSVDTRS